MLDSNLMRLQYEILNVSVEQLAAETKISATIISSYIKSEQWTRWWPEPDLDLAAPVTPIDLSSGNCLPPPDQAELFTIQTENFLDRSRRRLAVYTLAKEIYLAQKYLKVEAAVLDKLHDIATASETLGADGIKKLASAFKDLCNKNSLASSQSISFGPDESGIPSVIIRDLSGSKPRTLAP